MTLGPCHAALDGYDLHAGVVVRAGERERLERLCRYTLRPPLALTRLRVDAEGQVCEALRHQWSDGTTHLRFDPITFLERLAVLVPRPRINLGPGRVSQHPAHTDYPLVYVKLGVDVLHVHARRIGADASHDGNLYTTVILDCQESETGGLN